MKGKEFIIVSILTVLFLSLSCGGKKQSSECFFVDDNNIIHIDKDCATVDKQSYLVIYSGIEIARYFCENNLEYNVCAKCADKSTKDKINKEVEKYNNEKKRELKKLKEEYEALCMIGKDKWAYFDNYCRFIKNEENRDKLDDELRIEGYECGLLSLQDCYWSANELKYDIKKVLWNESYIGYLYFKMLEAGVNVGSIKYFREKSLKDKDDFVWYYNKSVELGLVDSWEDFLMLMFEPDCGFCDCEQEYFD